MYDRSDPSRFRVVGFEDTPGYFVRGLRAAFMAAIMGSGILFVLAIALAVPALWLALWGLFVGDQEMSELTRPGQAAGEPEGVARGRT